FSGPFLVWHPTKYADLLAERLRRHGAQTWLVNTGWSGGKYGVGKRMRLKDTRAIVDAIHDGSLAQAPTRTDVLFGFEVPTSCPNVASELLDPRNTWEDKSAFDQTSKKLANLFCDNFKKHEQLASPEVRAAGPRL